MYCTVLLYTLEAAGAGEARSVQKEKCTVQVYTGSGQAGQSVRRPPLPLSVQLQALQSSLREDSKQIVMGYQSANWCLEWKAKWLLASDLAKCQDILLEPPSASSEPNLIPNRFMTEGGEEEISRNTKCLCRAEWSALSVHHETANGDSELWKEVINNVQQSLVCFYIVHKKVTLAHHLIDLIFP